MYHEEHDGVFVHRSWVYAAANKGRVRRSVSFASFAASAMVFGPRLPKPDVVISTSPQFLAGVAGAMLARLRRVPLIVEIRDLWPESIAAVGVLGPDHPAMRAMEGAERWMYRTADTIVVVSDAFVNHVQARAPGRPRSQVPVITNGVDLERFTGAVPNAAVRAAGNGKPIALYAGTHGVAQGLEVVVDAAKLVPEVHFVFIGEGAAKADLKKRSYGLDNITFMPGVQRDQMPGIYAAADACLVPLRDLDILRTVIPSKLFEIWAMERAVVLGGRGTAAGLVEASGGGVVVEPENPEALGAALRDLFADASAAETLGKTGRAHVEAFYDRDKLAARYLDVMQETVERAR